MRWTRLLVFTWLVCGAACDSSYRAVTPKAAPETPAHRAQTTARQPVVQPRKTRWLGAWATAPQLVENGVNSASDNRPPNPPGLANNTLRQVIFPTVGGVRVRVEVSNRWGETPLDVQRMHLAKAKDIGDIDPSTDAALTFDGHSNVTIAAHSTVWSDAVTFQLEALSRTAITMVFGANVPSAYTGHPGSRTDSFLQAGNAVAEAALSHAVRTEHWYYITKVDVENDDERSGAIVAFGDSITDGRGSTSNGSNRDQRWTDHLARRLQGAKATQAISVLNLGIGGNRVNGDGLGPSGVERFERDVLEQSGVKWVIILHGINDIGADGSAAVAPLLQAYQGFIELAHAHGVAVFGAPLLPFEGSAYAREPEHVRAHASVNAWIRASGQFDAVIDFDQAVGDPANPTRLIASFQRDSLHPTAALYRAMAEVIDTSLFH